MSLLDELMSCGLTHAEAESQIKAWDEIAIDMACSDIPTESFDITKGELDAMEAALAMEAAIFISKNVVGRA
jgi:hypothetical protein